MNKKLEETSWVLPMNSLLVSPSKKISLAKVSKFFLPTSAHYTFDIRRKLFHNQNSSFS